MRYFFILMMIWTTCLQAQHSSKTHLFLKLGINANYISGPNCQIYEPHRYPGFNFGLGIEQKSDSLSTAGVELAYNARNAIWGRGFLGVDGDYVIYTLKYLSIKPYYRLKSNIGGLLKNFYVETGFVLSYNIYARQDWTVEMDEFYDSWEVGPADIRPEINKLEWGIFYGISFPYFGPVSIDFSFYHALSHLYGNYKNYKDDLKDKSEFKNHSFIVSLTYRFRVGN